MKFAEVPPTLLVKAPRTASEVEVAKVMLEAAVTVVLLLEVALPVMVQPPEELLKRMPEKLDEPGVMVLPTLVEMKETVPLALLNAPVLVNEPPTESVPTGSVVVPALIVKLPRSGRTRIEEGPCRHLYR